MSELSPRTRALLDASRAARNPSPQQLEHVRHSLLAKLAAGATAVGYGATVGTASAASGVGLGAKVIAVAAVALGGWGGFQWATQSAAQPAPLALPADRVPAPRQAASEVAVAASAEEPAAAKPAEPVSPRPVAPRIGSSSAQRATPEDSLLEEARLLGEVQKALGGGRVADALSRLGEYDARFPRGSLRVEAEAARVLALCQGGSSGPGRAAAERFLKRYPGSPAASRVRQACPEPVR
jgi:hypothetical protein